MGFSIHHPATGAAMPETPLGNSPEVDRDDARVQQERCAGDAVTAVTAVTAPALWVYQRKKG